MHGTVAPSTSPSDQHSLKGAKVSPEKQSSQKRYLACSILATRVRFSPYIVHAGIYGHILFNTTQPRVLIVAKVMNGLMEIHGPLATSDANSMLALLEASASHLTDVRQNEGCRECRDDLFRESDGRNLQIGYLAGCTPSSFGSNAATAPLGW